jgi:GNAT superfamily N-acetyltransferase
MSADAITIERLSAAQATTAIDELAEILRDCVDDGAAVNFMHPFSQEAARAFWSRAIAGLAADHALLLVARHDGRLSGTVMLGLDTPPNQPHRADVKKLLVHGRARRHGLARKLILAAEAEALSLGRTLLTLDTRHGDKAEQLYLSLGYRLIGIVPRYSLPPWGGLADDCAFYYKELQ